MVDVPTGTVTFLFTDVEGSTRLWEEHPEAMRSAVARHETLLATAIDSQSGHLVKGTGDGVLAVFSTAEQAAHAAVAAQLALSAEPWPAETPIRVRMGVHTGVAQYRDDDYYGPVVNRAARLMGVGHGGQVLLSETSASLVREQLPSGVGLVDAGEHRLRDLSLSVRVFQLTHDDLPGEFPPLRSLSTATTNLPVQTTRFIGRASELAHVLGALDEASVVTLTGVGGVGKTRLALHAAAEALPDYDDGAWLVELAAVRDPGAVLEAMADDLGVQPRPGQAMDDAVLDYLRDRRLLLLLDNCEHLLDSVATFVRRVVQTCPKVTVLATSREGLGLAGERMIAVPSLEAAGDAVELFVDRASNAKAGFTVTSDTEDAVSQLCHRLDGVPLAIELAASRVRMMTPTELVERIDERFRLLTGSSRTATERHQTLRATIDWSYDMLTAIEQQVLARLAVFAGGFTLDAAEAVAEDPEILDTVGRLVDKSLVLAEEVGGRTRFRLLETIRQYAQERLEESALGDAARHRHASYFVALSEQAGPGLRGPSELEWIARLDPETDNLRVAMAWCVEAGEVDLALRMVAPLTINGIPLGQAALAWADTAITIPQLDDHPLFPAVVSWAAWRAVVGADFDRAEQLIVRMDDAADRRGVPRSPACYQAPATLALLRGDFDEAAAQARPWIDAARAAGDDYELAQGLTMLAAALQPDAEAVVILEEAIEFARRLGNPSALSWVVASGAGYLMAHDEERALLLAQEAVEVCTALGNQWALANALVVVGWLHLQRGEDDLAGRALATALEHEFRFGVRGSTLSGPLAGIGVLLERAGIGDDAAVLQFATEEIYALWPSTGPWVERDRSIAALRDRLGSDRFEELRGRGAAMSIEEAVALARGALATLGINPDPLR